MKNFLLAAVAATFLAAPAAAQQSETDFYGEVKLCLEQISVSYNGAEYYLQEETHFRNAASADPDVIAVVNIQIAAGLRSHPLWRDKVGEIEACLAIVPNLQYTGRSN